MSKKQQRKNPHLAGLPTTGGSYVRTAAGDKYRTEPASPPASEAPADTGEAATDPNPKRAKR